MSTRGPSLFLYNFEITPTNRFITFGNASLDIRVASLNLGFYSLSTLGEEIVRAMTAADPLNKYFYSVNRNVMGGLQNRFTIGTLGSFLSIYFGTGNPSNPASLIGFNTADYTGSLTYTGSASCGTVLVPNQLGYNFIAPEKIRKNFGVVNVSASGLKEAIVFSLQKFWQIQFKYIPDDVVDSQWAPLVDWMIAQRDFEFTPNIYAPNTFYVGTLEEPSQGLEFNFSEQLPDFPHNYSTPLMKFRVRN